MTDCDEYKLQDSRELLDVVDKKSIQTTITSPPYHDMKDYGYDEQIGFGQQYENYLNDLKKVYSQVYDATKDDGTCWIMIDTFKRDGEIVTLPFDLAEKMKEIGWHFQDIIVWDKEKTLPWSQKGRMRNVFEYILFFTKSGNGRNGDFKYRIDQIKRPQDLKKWWVKYPERYNPKGKVPENIWDFKIPTQGSWAGEDFDHFCPFPTELVEQLIMLSTDEGDTVLDPFAGTGVVMAQALAMDRDAVGTDLNEEYRENYCNSIKDHVFEKWEDERKEYWEDLEEGRKEMRGLVHDLRKNKYPKAIIRRLMNDYNWDEDSHKINTVIAIDRELDDSEIAADHKFMYEDLYFLTEEDADVEQLQKDIDEISSTPPESKFGIESENYVMTVSEFEEKYDRDEFDFGDEVLWLYTKGQFNIFESQITIKQWKNLHDKDKWLGKYKSRGVPAIITNVKTNKPAPGSKETKNTTKQKTLMG